MMSGGAGSWGAARRVVERYGPDDVALLFCDTQVEDWDLYRFLGDAAAYLGVPLIRLRDGRTPWDVFVDEGMIGNDRAPYCSRLLKTRLARDWVWRHCGLETTTIYVGIDWTEMHRLPGVRRLWHPWRVEAPLCEPPYVEKAVLLEDMRRCGIDPPRLYALGAPHNNCGGFCVRAGQTHFRWLYQVMPERYLWHEAEEERARQAIGRDVAILTDRSGGQRRPLTLRELRERIEQGHQVPLFDWGGCGCFVDDSE
jgi:hypothetical protein